MNQLTIVWQRLVSDDDRTCDRCSATYGEVQRAVSTLTEVLRPLDIEGGRGSIERGSGATRSLWMWPVVCLIRGRERA